MLYVSGSGNIAVGLLSMKALGFHQKYLNSEDKRRFYGLGTTWRWVTDDRIFIFWWTILTEMHYNIVYDFIILQLFWSHMIGLCLNDVMYWSFSLTMCLYHHIMQYMTYLFLSYCDRNVGWDLVLSTGCWLDRGRSKCELAVECKKVAEF